jgi:hypothetical protein
VAYEYVENLVAEVFGRHCLLRCGFGRKFLMRSGCGRDLRQRRRAKA